MNNTSKTTLKNKLQTKLTELEIPSPKEVFQFKIEHWVEQLKTTPIKSDLNPYLGGVLKNLEAFSKEELVELFLSKEFQSFDFNAKPCRHRTIDLHLLAMQARAAYVPRASIGARS